MSFKTFLAIFSVIAVADGVIAILAPGGFMNLIWHQRSGPEAHLFIQGWGACLLASGILAWSARRMDDSRIHQMFATAFLTYNLIVAALWLIDALAHGWTVLSVATFMGLLLFAVGFARFRFIRAE